MNATLAIPSVASALSDAEAEKVDARVRALWLGGLGADAKASVYLHPDMVASAAPDAILWEGRGRDGKCVKSLAVLAAKRIRIRPVPGLPMGFSLSARRLVGDQVLGDDGPEAVASLLDHVGGLLAEGLADAVIFEDVRVGTGLWDGLEAGKGRHDMAVFYPGQIQPHWWIEFPSSGEDYWKGISRNTRKNCRGRVKKLEHQLICYRRPDEVERFLEKAEEVSKKTWQAKRLGAWVRNDEQSRRFWRTLAELGAMRNYILEHGGRPVAFMAITQFNRRAATEVTGYDAELAEMGPGTVLVCRMIEDMIASDTPGTLDFGYGDNQYKRSFSNQQSQSGPVLLVRRGVGPMLAMWAQQARGSAARRLRAGLARAGLLKRIHQMYRS